MPAMINHILAAQQANLAYARKLVADLSPQQMVAQPVAGQVMNHAAWTLGHLVMGTNFTLSFFGEKGPQVPTDWPGLFAPGKKPDSEAGRHPDKAALLAALEAAYRRLAEVVAMVPPAKWAEPFPIEKFRSTWPTLGDGIVFMMTVHDATHLGQLSAWRRALGLAAV